MKKIAAALFCIFVSLSSHAEIYTPENMSEIKGMVEDIFDKRNPQKTLFILPLDFILRSTHPAMQKQERNYNSLLKKAFAKVNSSATVYADRLILSGYPQELTDQGLPDLIDYIQKNNSAVIITTPNITAGFNDIKFFDIWTFNYLKSKKIDLAKGVFANTQLIFNKEMKQVAGAYPTFYKGLLSYNSDKVSNSPMQSLSVLLVMKLKKIPDVVVGISSSRNDLEGLEKQLKILRADNEFFGILYNLPALKTEDISPENYLKFWQDFVSKLNKVKGNGVDLKSENPYEE